jgi:hypothetical protein
VNLKPFGYEKRRDTLVVLGAGATRGASFVGSAGVLRPPLDTDFFTQLRASRLADDDDGQRLLEFVEAEFGDFDVSMEAFYSQVHLHDQFVAEVPKGSRGRRRSYGWAMRRFLRLIPPLFGASIGSANCRWHDALVRRLDAEDVVISFNYDCVIDRSLRNVGNRRWDSRSGYGVPAAGDLAAWRDHSGTGRFPKQGLRLLKLHGSLNWRQPRGGGQLELLADPYQRRDEQELCIVPPLWQKSYEARPFHDLWVTTRRLLATRKALIFIGYSLPTTDVYTQAMLRIDVPELDFLLVVNPDHQARTRIRRVLRSALRPATRLVELDSISELGMLLERDSPAATPTEARRFEQRVGDALKRSPYVSEVVEPTGRDIGADFLLRVDDLRVAVEVKYAIGPNQSRRLREAVHQVERSLELSKADVALIVVPNPAASALPPDIDGRIWLTTLDGLPKTLAELRRL